MTPIGAAALMLIASFTVWSIAGWKQLRVSSAGQLFRLRNTAVLYGLVPCFLWALIALISAGRLPPLLIAFGSALAFLAHAASEPSGVGFWHHKRLRPIGIGLALAAALGLGLFVAEVVLIPVVFAAAIFHRHQRRGTALVTQCFDDVDGLRSKLLTLEAERLSDALIGPTRKNTDDRRSRAG